MLAYLAAEVLKEAKYTITEFTMKNRKHLSEFADLEVDLPKFDLPEPNVDISSNELHHDAHDIEADDEGAMVKADLYKLAKYSVKLFKKIEDEDQFESWVQAKITKAADYISSVYHYLEYEMKFSEYGDKIENSDMYSESQKRQMKNALLEAKKTLAALKIDQAEKLDKTKTVKEGMSHTCGECGGSGMVEKALPEATKQKVEKYNRQAKAYHAASKRLDKNNNGIPDDEEFEEEAITPVKKPSPVADKKGSNPFAKKDEKKSGNGDAFKKELDKVKSKQAGGRRPEDDVDEDSCSKPKSTTNSQDTGNPYASKSKTESVYEAKKKPSAGLSAEKKSAVVKKAKAGGDIGKPGKNFDTVASKAGGGEKGKKIAAAAMWKNIKESAKEKADKDYDGDGKIESGKEEHKGSIDKAIKASKEKEVVKESVELSRLREITSRVIR
jgi:hypothetical protein